MLDKEQQIADAALPALLHQRTLQRERFAIWNETETTNLYTMLGSQFSSDRLRIDMNSSATAPSMTRWS